MSEPLVLVSHLANVRTLALNWPQALNSFTTPMHAELMAALDAVAADDAALAAEARLQSAMGHAPDHREGVAAFMAKRKPRFSDR